MSAPASWRDPGDWPFLLTGVALRAWCSLVTGVDAAREEWRSWR